MLKTQSEIDIYYYARWEVASAREHTARGLAFFIALPFAIAIDSKYDFWLWDIAAFVAGWWFAVFGLSDQTAKAWREYENRPMLPEVE